MPVVLDVGTNNEDLLNDPLYLGMGHPRLEGEDYYSFVDEWVTAVTSRWPGNNNNNQLSSCILILSNDNSSRCVNPIRRF